MNCPYDNRLKKLMEKIKYKEMHGLINTSELQRKLGIIKDNELLKEVENFSIDTEEDLVFSHGDYSLPNLII